MYDPRTGAVGPQYLSAGGQWHRFYLDAGLLFWQEGQMPDPEYELSGDDEYISLAEELRVKGVRIRRVEMEDSELSVLFENSARLRIFCDVQSEFPVFRDRSPAPA